jgi:hypothetical protein
MKAKYPKSTSLIIFIMMIMGSLWNDCHAQQLMPVDGLWYTWTTEDGILYDDGDFGGNYTNDGLGALTIYPIDQSNDKIFLRFIEFRVEFQGSCGYDYLEVYDGDDMSNLIGKYCGSNLPDVVQSTHVTGAITLLWSSDGSVTDAGFKIRATVISPMTTVQLGDVNSTTTNGRVPSYGYYDYSWSSLIYESTDIGAPIVIDEIQFDVENDINTTMTNQKIYIAHTTMNIFPNGSEPKDGDIQISDWTLVYAGDISWTQGWNSITLDGTFMYDGLSNLLIKTVNEHGSWTFDYPLFRYTAKANTVVYNYADGGMPSSSGFRNGFRPNMRFGFGSGGGSLPIVLTSFTGEVTENSTVNLNWVVVSQINNDYFTIERSRDCKEWEIVNKINGAGNNNTEMSYNLLDTDPYKGLSYYRLTQTDYDGKYETFNPVSVEISEYNTIGLSITPNPAIDHIQLELVYPNDHPINHDVKIYNSQGKEVYKMFYIGELNSFSVDIKKLKPGYYIVKTKSDNNKGTGKFIKE